jgi:acetyl-CoA carboxylase carboxyltransferase component
VSNSRVPKITLITGGSYERQTDVRYAAARLWVDAILDPVHTRGVLIESLAVATRHASDEPFRVGVYQV